MGPTQGRRQRRDRPPGRRRVLVADGAGTLNRSLRPGWLLTSQPCAGDSITTRATSISQRCALSIAGPGQPALGARPARGGFRRHGSAAGTDAARVGPRQVTSVERPAERGQRREARRRAKRIMTSRNSPCAAKTRSAWPTAHADPAPRLPPRARRRTRRANLAARSAVVSTRRERPESSLPRTRFVHA